MTRTTATDSRMGELCAIYCDFAFGFYFCFILAPAFSGHRFC